MRNVAMDSSCSATVFSTAIRAFCSSAICAFSVSRSFDADVVSTLRATTSSWRAFSTFSVSTAISALSVLTSHFNLTLEVFFLDTDLLVGAQTGHLSLQALVGFHLGRHRLFTSFGGGHLAKCTELGRFLLSLHLVDGLLRLDVFRLGLLLGVPAMRVGGNHFARVISVIFLMPSASSTFCGLS